MIFFHLVVCKHNCTLFSLTFFGTSVNRYEAVIPISNSLLSLKIGVNVQLLAYLEKYNVEWKNKKHATVVDFLPLLSPL